MRRDSEKRGSVCAFVMIYTLTWTRVEGDLEWKPHQATLMFDREVMFDPDVQP